MRRRVALALFPIAVAGKAHAEERGHLGLGEFGVFADGFGVQGAVNGGRAFAFLVGDGFSQGLDEIGSELGHGCGFWGLVFNELRFRAAQQLCGDHVCEAIEVQQ